ncbi:quinone-dependent dihydroorotate dehydrogenase [Mesorhizobium sp. M4B.F.Ca.ET.190.01.1.1]|uniref:quinone-dependent dihydroorotate dehydrogenase n=1 Tax=unclassified Mesorhizobium TaxID=325217 RepID=UPI000FEA4F9A|nr:MULTISPECIES: quinone-dependent dihydroorotate dehydrogenase [unclassified Mesorhizobium]RWA61731.1 MAG: quinone-dependent dihydroorotate dehydrogenase [Mesorhizobium sp.]RWF62569.1 MAG: quinone-dependent dihydroorotate dehydrogenase [Mesorhizobium sp.]TGR08146.1 quinone-dependent dihydroorotate dehydrogenase [Mesorhizobium sp. M4B.F.Ca.ET.200.01.1.1]TGS17502.1 quinone-dependent dihydroorotate dehydrogenase [Mesorhizobium sp. M4B.F.Ca.ET.190.01.1.1]TGT29828.1 quinone-dependent dihydroorotat
MSVLDRIGQKVLFTLDPETAHGLSIAALRCGLPVTSRPPRDERLELRVAGLDFPNPLGMAAGYDKNAEVPDALLGLGFGFAEVGTVTPLAQTGNPKPRIFRLMADEAVINRLGFNNEGHEAAEKRLAARKGRPGIVGVNIGANKDSADRIADYERGVARFAPHATYLTVNISSPNTPGLRNMQAREQLGELLSRVMAARASAAATPPVFLKIAPDLVEAELEDIAAEVAEKGIDGVIVSNTTLARTGLRSATVAGEAGGLSGKPLFERSTAVLARMRKLVGPEMAIIGVGGVDSTETALEKIRAGADLVQLYTGMIYAGPSLPGRIVAGMARFVEREGLSSLRELRDSRLDHWAVKAY